MTIICVTHEKGFAQAGDRQFRAKVWMTQLAPTALSGRSLHSCDPIERRKVDSAQPSVQGGA